MTLGAPTVVTERKSRLESPRLPKLGVGQSMVYRSMARWVVLVAGRRFGKSTLESVRLFNKAYTKPGSENWYIAPTYRQAKTIFWERLKETVPRMYVTKRNESELTIVLKNRSRIVLKGADNPDSLRGPGLDHVSFDEFANVPLEAWNVIRPALSDKGGTAAFVGSPSGFNHLYEFFNRGTIDRNKPNRRGRFPWRAWEGFLFTTLQGGRVPLDEIEAARDELDPRVFRQEYLASFETLAGRVYGNFSRQVWPLGNIDPYIIDVQRELYVGMDFNINPMTAVVAQSVFGRPEVLDAIQLMTSSTEEMGAELRRRYPDRRVIICPDASGQYGKGTNAPFGQTDITILKRHGFEILSDKGNPVVVDRINNFQSNLLSGSGYRALKIHPRAELLVRALEGLTWKKGTNIVDKKSGLDHICFAAGTEIETDAGVLPIEQLPASGRVRGPYGGFVDYIGAGRTQKNAETVRVTFASGESVTCTPDHPFLTDSGWKPASELVGNRCYSWVCDLESSVPLSKNSMGSAITNAASISSGLASGCISSFGKPITGRDHQTSTSTTSIATKAITRTPTLERSGLGYMLANTWRIHDDGMQSYVRSDSRNERRGTGIGQRMVGCGTESTTRNPKPSCTRNGILTGAHTAVRSSTVTSLCEPSFAAGNARHRGVDPVASIARRELAQFAAERFASTDMRVLSTVHDDAARSYVCGARTVVSVEPAVSQDVFTLTVPNVGAFALASGVVVSNCDAGGYLLWQMFNVLAKHVPAVAPAVDTVYNPYGEG